MNSKEAALKRQATLRDGSVVYAHSNGEPMAYSNPSQCRDRVQYLRDRGIGAFCLVLDGMNYAAFDRNEVQPESTKREDSFIPVRTEIKQVKSEHLGQDHTSGVRLYRTQSYGDQGYALQIRQHVDGRSIQRYATATLTRKELEELRDEITKQLQ